jgi:hypothetical protein
MSPKDRAQHGAALAKGAAFDAVYGLWRRRSAEGWPQARVASNVDVDEGWLSKQFVGPRNWTMESVGTLVEGLDGQIEIIVRANEDVASDKFNYDAYAEYGIYADPAPSQPRPARVPSEKKSAVAGSSADPTISSLLNKIISKQEPALVPGI